MQLIKDENKISWNQTEKLIIDPTLDLCSVTKQEIC